MVYGDFKDLPKRTVVDKVLRAKLFNIAIGYQHGLTSMVYKFFDKNLQVEQLKMKLFLIKN